MPVIYTIDRSERVVYLSTFGDPSFDEWRDTPLKVFSDPAFETGFHLISDRRRATAPSAQFVERQIVFVREHARELGRCRWAAIVPDPATDKAARSVTSRAGMAEVEVGFFYDLFGVEPKTFQRVGHETARRGDHQILRLPYLPIPRQPVRVRESRAGQVVESLAARHPRQQGFRDVQSVGELPARPLGAYPRCVE